MILVGNYGLSKDWDSIFCSCNVLYIDDNNLTPYQRSNKTFTEINKAKEFRANSCFVLMIFKAGSILKDRIDLNVFYFLNYNKKVQLKFCKRLDLTRCIKDDINYDLRGDI